MERIWFCEGCKIKGIVESLNGDKLTKGQTMMANAEHHTASPNCNVAVKIESKFEIRQENSEVFRYQRWQDRCS